MATPSSAPPSRSQLGWLPRRQHPASTHWPAAAPLLSACTRVRTGSCVYAGCVSTADRAGVATAGVATL